MEIQESINQTKIRTLENDPQYFGAYLNMARHNIYAISNNVGEKLPTKSDYQLNDEAGIPGSFLTKDKETDFNWRLTYAMTRRFMPLLKVFDDEVTNNEFTTDIQGVDYNKMRTSLKLLFTEINQFRNDYSHYYHALNGTNRKTHISEELAFFLREAYQKAIEFTKLRFKANSTEQENVLNDEDFNLCSGFKMVEADNKITREGLVFLICLFLEREYAFQFIGKIKGLKGTQFKSFIAVREVLMAYCVKMPHDKMISQDAKQALSLDLINEINKCPKELYEVITAEAKQAFQPKLSEIKQNNLIENSTNEETELLEDYDKYVESLTKRIRHENRFPYYALRFIDETNIFTHWFTHINLGRLLLKKYPKKIRNEEMERLIVEDVRTFGKLNDYLFSEEEIESNKQRLLKQIDPDDKTLEFEQFAPHYHIKNCKIGISRKKDQPSVYKKDEIAEEEKYQLKQPLPDAFLSTHELSKIILLEYLKKGAAEKLIDDFFNQKSKQIYKIDFIKEVKNKLPDWEPFFKNSDSKKYRAYEVTENSKFNEGKLEDLLSSKSELNAVLIEYGLNWKQIPTKILDYWLEIKDVKTERKISDYIKLQKEDCKQKIKALEKKEKEGKGRVPKIGEMATYLARDIVSMIISEEKKKKITSFYYDKIQECLALYADPEKKKLLSTLLFSELKLNEPGGHPFIGKINFGSIDRTYDLYKQYFTEKGYKKIGPNNDISWLNQTFYKNKKDEKGKWKTEVVLPANNDKVPYSILKLKEKQASSLEIWIKNNTKGCKDDDNKKPVDLPTNLFDNTIIELLKKELEMKAINFSSSTNLNQLFKLWWDKVRKDDVQHYYSSEREYKIYDEKVVFVPGSKPKYADYYGAALQNAFNKKIKENSKLQKKQVEKVFMRTIARTEKDIRLIQENDRVALLMIEQLVKTDNLAEFYLKDAKELLNQTVPVKQKVPGILLFDEEGNFTENRENKIEKTIVAERKRKDASVLRKFIHDRRLPELFEYYNEEEIAMQTLKNELDEYNKAKEQVLDKAFELEEAIINQGQEVVNTLEGDKNIQHKPYLNWLLNNEFINEKEYTFLNMVRNTFSHNQFPQKKTMELFIGNWENGKFARTIAEEYNQKIDNVIGKLN